MDLYSIKYSYQTQIILQQIYLTHRWDPNLGQSGSGSNGNEGPRAPYLEPDHQMHFSVIFWIRFWRRSYLSAEGCALNVMVFLRVLLRSEMPTTLFRIWTWVTKSILYDNNFYAKSSTSHVLSHPYLFIISSIWIHFLNHSSLFLPQMFSNSSVQSQTKNIHFTSFLCFFFSLKTKNKTQYPISLFLGCSISNCV